MIREFLEKKGPLLDVRSPQEYKQGYIPGAISLPLFSDEERAAVGTLYKQTSAESAYLKGLDIVGPKLSQFAAKALEYKGQKVRIYCWRGGSRSQSMAWLFNLMGVKTETLKGGYKTFRRAATHPSPLLKDKKFLILGGWTGSGKTEFLRSQTTLPYLDLEEMASHRGSAFGALEGISQPTQEHFENLIFSALLALPSNCTVLIENESRLIGKLVIPTSLYEIILSSPLLFLDLPKEERLKFLLKTYTIPSLEAVKKIEKKLGSERTRLVESLLKCQDYGAAASILLDYYDRSYLNSLKNPPFFKFSNQQLLQQHITSIYNN